MEGMEGTGRAYADAWEAVRQKNAQALENAPCLREELSLSAADAGALYKTAHEAFALENFKEAENLFTALVLLDPQNRDFQTGLAAALEALENFGGAISFYANAASLSPSCHLYYRLGKCFMGLGEKDWAVFMFERAAEGGGGADLRDRLHGEKAKQMAALLRGAAPVKGETP